jgi:hypothetical protein
MTFVADFNWKQADVVGGKTGDSMSPVELGAR